jgi:hypothetical protein
MFGLIVMHNSYPHVCVQISNAVLTCTYALALDSAVYAEAYKSQEIL